MSGQSGAAPPIALQFSELLRELGEYRSEASDASDDSSSNPDSSEDEGSAADLAIVKLGKERQDRRTQRDAVKAAAEERAAQRRRDHELHEAQCQQ